MEWRLFVVFQGLAKRRKVKFYCFLENSVLYLLIYVYGLVYVAFSPFRKGDTFVKSIFVITNRFEERHAQIGFSLIISRQSCACNT